MLVKKFLKLLFWVLIIIPIMGCSDTESRPDSEVKSFEISRMQKLIFESPVRGDVYQWKLIGIDGGSKVVSGSDRYIFISAVTGKFKLILDIKSENTEGDKGQRSYEYLINVVNEKNSYSPYISKVYEYRPAPGQFINTTPVYENGDTEEEMRGKVEDCIKGENRRLVSLGAFGGYVVFGFDHTVVNSYGPDIYIEGNAIYQYNVNGRNGGSAEPGIVSVCCDYNMNGLPDDGWFELAGSEYSNPLTIRNYRIDYKCEGGGNVEHPADEVISWRDSKGENGKIERVKAHTQFYYPQWIKESVMTFIGSRLPGNVETPYGNSYFILFPFETGYVDNHPNSEFKLNSFDISNARDEAGNPVNLPGVDFIKVATGLNQTCGWLGETSTEICHARDLNMDK